MKRGMDVDGNACLSAFEHEITSLESGSMMG